MSKGSRIGKAKIAYGVLDFLPENKLGNFNIVLTGMDNIRILFVLSKWSEGYTSELEVRFHQVSIWKPLSAPGVTSCVVVYVHVVCSQSIITSVEEFGGPVLCLIFVFPTNVKCRKNVLTATEVQSCYVWSNLPVEI